MPSVTASRGRPASLRLELAGDLSQVRPASGAVHDFLAECGWSDEDLIPVDLALVEACNNALEYAGETGRGKPVVIHTQVDGNEVEIRIHDHTPGFEWPERAQLPSPESESGRGIYLIQSTMDSAAYFRGAGENVLVLRKRREQADISSTIPANTASLQEKLAENERIIGEMIEELSSCYESLAAIFRYSADQGKEGDLREFAGRLGRDLQMIVAADWFVLRLLPRPDGTPGIFAASELAKSAPSIPPAASPDAQAAESRDRVWFESVPTDSGLPAESAGVVQPIQLGSHFLGTLTLGKRRAEHAVLASGALTFSAAQMNVIATLADFLAIQAANHQFHEERLHQRLVTHELEIANRIQRSLLQSSLPQVPGFSLAGFSRNAREVGGDFYDVLRVDDDTLLLIIADVMGKGIPAALFAASLRTLLRAAPELTTEPAALLGRVNRLLAPELSGVDMFITAQLACLHAADRQLVLASAGHCPLALAVGGEVRRYTPDGLPLGVLPDTTYVEETVALPKGSVALLYTDGLSEARNERGELWGEPRLLQWLGAAREESKAYQLREQLAAELHRYQGGTPVQDDQTFLVLAG